MTIDTSKWSAHLRALSVNLERRELLITRFVGTGQEVDLSEPSNCHGHGRIRHFRRETAPGWPDNPLPIDPAAKALGLEPSDMMRAQVFQNAACNWRCWYCYVPFKLLNADPALSSWLSAEILIDWYLDSEDPPAILDLSGGQPDLVPEWTAWMARTLRERRLEDRVFLWVDDNLSNDYFWTYLNDDDRADIRAYRSHARVGCFKGYDERSFAFNSGADAELFSSQFKLMARHLDEGTDCYAYVTLTSPTSEDPSAAMARFVDRLQEIHVNFPLRVVPLEIEVWGPVQGRVHGAHSSALEHQQDAIHAWNAELEVRFSSDARALRVFQVDVSSS